MVAVNMDDGTATLIRVYDCIHQQLALLQNPENQMKAIDCKLKSILYEEFRRSTLLKQTEEANAYMQKRVHRNEYPRFLHYFVCNREAKVQRLKEELQNLQTIVQDLSKKVSDDSSQLTALRRQKRNAHTTVIRKQQMEGLSHQLFIQVVDGQPPTDNLKNLRAEGQQQRSLLASEQVLLDAVGKSVQQVQQGLLLFQQAEGHYRHARSINERVKCGSPQMCDEDVGYDFGAEDSGRNRQKSERQDSDLQNVLDRTIDQAHGLAMKAYQLMSTGLASFPAEAKAQYPQLCASMRQVAFPRVQGASPTGALEDNAIFDTPRVAMTGMTSGCQIQDNVKVMGQCASMTSQQLSLMESTQNAVTMNVQQLQASLRTLERNIVAERNNIFNGLHAKAMALPVA